MKLSIAMMVKNESKYIGRCLEALQPIRDAVDSELIIVDTGSEDNTVEIARKFTDKVFFHEWNNDFAQMRNITIGYTKGEWIFVLDADEIIENPSEIISFFNSGICDKYNSAIVFIKNIMNEKEKADFSLLPLVRLFKRYEGFRYEGIVHEQPKFREPVFMLQARLMHYGYIHTDKEQMERKFKRNVPLLEKQLKKEPDNHYTWYQLSKSYAAYENYTKALEMCSKAYDIAKKKNVLGKSMYIYIQLALCYYWNHKFEELEDLCLEALKPKGNHIDFYFLLGKAQMVLGKDLDAIHNYEIYMDMLKDFHNYYNSGDITASAYTTGHADVARTDLAVLYYKKKEYERVLEYAGMIKDERYLEKLYPQLIKAYIKLELYKDLFDYYKNKVLIQEENRINSFINALESIKLNIKKEESDKIEELFAVGEETYSDLNKLRISSSKETSAVDKQVIERLVSLDFRQLQPYYGDVVYYLMRNKHQLVPALSSVNENKILSYISYLVEKYEDSNDVLLDYLNIDNASDMEPAAQRIRRVLLKALLSVDKLDDTDYREVFYAYISNGIEYVKRVYNQSLIDSELVSEIKSNEDAFLMYMLLSEKYKHLDQRKHVSFIRKALKVYPEMGKGIELLMQDIQEIADESVGQDDKMNAGNKNTDGEILGHSADGTAHESIYNQNAQTEFDEYKSLIKKKIEELIESGELDAAENLIKEYENLVSGDADIYSMKAVICIARQELEIAEGILTEGMNACGHKFDLLYNMAYLYEITGRYCEAIRYYGFARDNCFDEETIGEITDKINELSASLEKTTEKLPHKRVLIIAHIFPPVGGSGVQRTLKFVKYLRDNGWEPVVVTVGESQYPLKDKSLVDEIPEGVKVVRIDEDFSVNQDILKEIIGLYSGMVNNSLLIKEYIKEVNSSKQDDLQKLLTIPDPFVFWANLVLKAIKSKIDFNDIDLIYSTSGPYSDHIIGYYLKKDYGKPWVADFRDEWTNNCYAVYDKKAIRYRLEFAMENSIVHYADKVITTTPVASENYRSIFSLEGEKVITITNGYDEEDFKDLTTQAAKNDKFTIMHNGLLYLARTPITFYKALSSLIKSGFVKRDKVKVYFTWTENDKLWKEYAEKFGLEDVIEFTGYLSHKDSLEKAIQADMLLLIVGPGEEKNSVYPGKIFEYLRLNKPILSLSPAGGIVEQLLYKTQSGYNADFDDVEKIESYILKLYSSWESGELSHRPDNKSIEEFSRSNLTSRISEVFNSLLRVKDNVSNDITDTEHNVEMLRHKKKLGFFSVTNGEKFLGDIISGLSPEYDIKLFIIKRYEEILEGMQWADICWFEWCDDLIEYASKLDIAKRKYIICRVHRYEVFTDFPSKVEWENVDKLIIVTDHLKALLEDKVPDIGERVNIVTIKNGVNLSRFAFSKRGKGYNIAFVGGMITRKNPMLLLQIAKKLAERDKRYKIYIAGEFLDEMLFYYWNYQIKEMKLEKNVFYEGFQNDISRWLEDKNYIISTTMHESFGYGIAEAMAQGIKPIIHNFVFSKEIWPEKYLFNTIDEAVEMIAEDRYESKEYREFIAKNYSLDSQLTQIRNLLSGLILNTGESRKDILTVDHVKNLNESFIPYGTDHVDAYDFSGIDILIGKRELITGSNELIECIIKNDQGKRVLILNVLYDRETGEISLPAYLSESRNKEAALDVIRTILKLDVKFIRNMGGFVIDEALRKDIADNAQAYGWERAVPGTQFMSCVGYLRIIERYMLAARFLNKSDIVLEAASGFGYGAAYLSRFCKRVEAVDIARDNISFAKNIYDFPSIIWQEGDVTKLHFDDNSFDAYISFETLEHLPLECVDMYFKEALRVIKHGGKMIISTPNGDMRKNIKNPFHVKEYGFSEFDNLLRKYFRDIEYFSSDDIKVKKGMSNRALNMIAVCTR